MRGVFSKSDDKKYQDISGNFKAFKNKAIEADEMFVITDAVQCMTSCHCAVPGLRLDSGKMMYEESAVQL